ncbi:MAG: hypothetical protein WAO19_02640 [Candidatus Kryptoniota bacterium]
MLLKIFLLVIITMNIAADSQKYVIVEVKSPTTNVENGKPFSFFIKIKPANGIHINVQPPISIKPLTDGTTMNVKEIPESGEYLDLSKPIEVEGVVTRMNLGQRKVNFVVSYTYCSEKEKWCRFGKDTISVSLRVKK